MEKKKVTLVIPMYYEEKVAEECYKRVKENLVKLENYDHEIIFVNDGSKDKSLEIIKKFREEDGRYNYIDFSRNFAHFCLTVFRFHIPKARSLDMGESRQEPTTSMTVLK